MNAKLITFLNKTIKQELKYMYSLDIEDETFGVETERYQWCKNVIDGNNSINNMILYYEKYYPKEENYFIDYIKELNVQ